MRRSAIPVLALVLSAALSTSCSDLTTVRPVVIRPTGAASPALFDRVVRATAAHGYELLLVQPERGRFAARLRYADRFGRYVVTVECHADGSIAITPIGPRVEHLDEEWILPSEVRMELVVLAEALERAARGG